MIGLEFYALFGATVFVFFLEELGRLCIAAIGHFQEINKVDIKVTSSFH